MGEYESRIIDRAGLQDLRVEMSGRKVVFTNGCFDLLHRGHVELLEKARSYGDCLVVGINSDKSLNRLKGRGRAITSEDDRAFILLSLDCVDYVTIFEEDTPLEVIRGLEPDVLVKGDEYELEDIVGADLVSRSGGEVKRVRMKEGYSTSEIIRRIKELF